MRNRNRQWILKRRPIGALLAMIGPERLRAIGHRHAVEGFFSRMRRGEGAVALGMPVLSQHDVIEAFGQTIDDRHHGVAIGNRKRSTGTEIVLHVDYQQQIVVTWPLHPGPAFVLITEI